jgi:hypothetical protein
MYRRLIVSIASAAALLAATPAFGQSFKPDSKAFGPSFQQNTTPPPAVVQQQPNTGLGFGLHFGGTWTSVSTESNPEAVNFDQGNGIVAGIFFGGNRDGRAGLQGEISYLEKKVNFSGTDDGETFERKANNKYIQIPVLLRINTGSRSNNGPCLFFLVGPAFDIRIADNAEDLFNTDVDLDVDEIYQGVEYGLMAGAGFEVARFGVQVRYTWGLDSIFGTDAARESGFGDTKFNSLQITGIFRIN